MTAPEVERMFDTYIVMQAQAALQLGDSEFLRFGQRLQQLQNVSRQHQNQRRKLLNELNEMTKPQPAAPADDATLAARTKALDDLELQEAQERQKALVGVDEVLTVRQRARFRIFMDNMERRKLELIALAREQARLPIKSPTTRK
jgi:hypothetical protein